MIPQAMKAVDFTPDESADQTTQMKVRRTLKRAREKCEDTTAHTPPPVSVVGVGPTPTTAVSTLTNASIHAPKLKLTRMTAAAKQQKLTNKLLMASHYSAALKKATSVYAEEMKKVIDGICVGKSAYKIAEEINLQFDGHGQNARTICLYVNEYNPTSHFLSPPT